MSCFILSPISLKQQDEAVCTQCCEDIESQHCIGMGEGYGSCFFILFQSWSAAKNQGICSTSLVVSTTMGTVVVIRALVSRQDLLIGVPMERCDGALVSCGVTPACHLCVADLARKIGGKAQYGSVVMESSLWGHSRTDVARCVTHSLSKAHIICQETVQGR